MSSLSRLPATREPAPHPPIERPLPTTRLPRPLTSFVGREREIDAVRGLLAHDDVRMLTLTGPGGVGKTRLALQVADQVDDVPDGVWFVDLTPIDNPALVAPAIARALDLRYTSDRPIDEVLADTLRGRRALLVLDNFEQVVPAGPLVSRLLASCPELTVLVTSRVALRVSSERLYEVPPLPVPESGGPGAMVDADAVRLFVDRAAARSAGFAVTADTADPVVELCRRLDGLPLAIELAAARVNVLSPAAMLERLDERWTLLAGGPSDEPARLRSMRDSIAWSFDLLAPDEQALFRRLGVFAGAWTLDGAEAVTGDDGDRPVLDRLAALVDASLVRQEPGPDGASAYTMLATIREFAAELLDDDLSAEEVRCRHAMFMTALAEQAEVAWFLPDGEQVISHLRIHAPNIYTALAWLERRCDVDELLRLAGSLPHFWNAEGQVSPGRAVLERAVLLGRETDSPHLGRALIALAAMMHMQGGEESALALCREGQCLVGSHGDLHARFLGYTLEGIITLRAYDHTLGGYDLEASEAVQQRALELARSAPELDWTGRAESTVLGHLGNIAVGRGDIDNAARWFERALEVQRGLGHEPGTSHIMANHPIAGLGDVARARGDLPAAHSRYRDALSLAFEFRDSRAIAYALGGVAATFAAAGNWRDAARLFGAAEAYHALTGYPFDLETMDRQRALGLPEPWLRAGESFGSGQPLRDALWADRDVSLPPIPDPDAASAQWEAGRALSIDEACAIAFETALDRPEASPGGLSERELEVLKLLVEGMSDREIAEALYISRRTAATHVGNIYTKLGVSSRASAAAWAVRNGLA